MWERLGQVQIWLFARESRVGAHFIKGSSRYGTLSLLGGASREIQTLAFAYGQEGSKRCRVVSFTC